MVPRTRTPGTTKAFVLHVFSIRFIKFTVSRADHIPFTRAAPPIGCAGAASCRVAQYKKRKTKQIKTNSITPTTRTPGKCLLCFIFPARRFIGGNILTTIRDHGKQCGSGSHAGAREAAHWGAGHARGLPGQAASCWSLR